MAQPSRNHLWRKRDFALSGVQPGDIVIHLRCGREDFLEPERLASLGRWMQKLAAGYGLTVLDVNEIPERDS